MADGLILRAHDKRGALAISPAIVILVGMHRVIHNSLILLPCVDFLVGIWVVIVVLLGGLWENG